MKRLITDKIYDIHDAKLVAEYNRGLDSIATETSIEELYLNKSGEYFLYRRSNAMTGRSNSSKGRGEGILPLTTQEARDWINQHCHDHKHYADVFGEAEE